MSKRIHIVSFDVPYPADYGGVIDVFSRVKWFAENGWKVILHCFEYKRPKATELETYAEVHYYSRPTGLNYWFSKTPFIVLTRINKDLEKTLRETKDEVILEGLHCSHYLNVQPGKFYARVHNIEHEYYENLVDGAPLAKSLYYKSEAKKLKNYESILSKAKGLLVISTKELAHFKKINSNSIVVPSIIEMNSAYQSTEPYVLYQGNLSVEENDQAAHWILDEIAPNLPEIKVVIAGKNPSESLKEKSTKLGVELIGNPNDAKMTELLQKARIHLLWTKNSSGLKLKFLKALASSGHVICSEEMTLGSSVTSGFHTIENPKQALEKIHLLMYSELSQEKWKSRQKELIEISGVQKLKDLFGE